MRAVPRTGRPPCCCTAFPTTCTPMPRWCRSSPTRAAAWSCPTCAASARRSSSMRPRRARASRRHSPPTCAPCSMRWRFRRPCWPATTGVARPPAWPRRCGPSAAPGSCPSTATRCRPSRMPDEPAPAGERVPLLVPVVLPHRTRPRRAGAEPARSVPAAVAALVAHLGLRRRDLGAHGARLRQPGFRRHRHPLVPAPLPARPRATRPARPRRPPSTKMPEIRVPSITFDGADDGVMSPAGTADAGPPLHRPAHAPHLARRGPQHAAGSTRACSPMRCSNSFPPSPMTAFPKTLSEHRCFGGTQTLPRTRLGARSACRCAFRCSCRRRPRTARCRR